ncbi:unnamed protein product [Auanema sp. JU1783]|nr:unnamed protein product [Auanema sp. JU1783]
MDRDTRDVVITALVGNITEINTLLRHPSVRGYLDTSIGRPEIDETSSLNDIVRRLKRQVRRACILADTTHTGPEANIWETEALTRTSEILEQTFDDIYQAPSCNGSYTATASD